MADPIFKALAHPIRRRVLELLRERPMTAGELAAQFDVSKPAMSAHFAALQNADLVESDRRGKQVIYQLKLSVLEDALLALVETFGLGATTDRAEPEPSGE